MRRWLPLVLIVGLPWALWWATYHWNLAWSFSPSQRSWLQVAAAAGRSRCVYAVADRAAFDGRPSILEYIEAQWRKDRWIGQSAWKLTVHESRSGYVGVARRTAIELPLAPFLWGGAVLATVICYGRSIWRMTRRSIGEMCKPSIRCGAWGRRWRVANRSVGSSCIVLALIILSTWGLLRSQKVWNALGTWCSAGGASAGWPLSLQIRELLWPEQIAAGDLWAEKGAGIPTWLTVGRGADPSTIMGVSATRERLYVVWESRLSAQPSGARQSRHLWFAQYYSVELRRYDADMLIQMAGQSSATPADSFFTVGLVRSSPTQMISVALPIKRAVPTLLIWPAAAFLVGPFRRALRAGRSLCRRCDYDLTGIEESRCPECGTKFQRRNVPPVLCGAGERGG